MVTSGAQLKKISKARLKSASVLINAEDWDGAVYMLCHVLECILKSAACKSLRLTEYPQNIGKDKHFMTHNFDQLLVLSGLSDIFNNSNSDKVPFRNWSEFTSSFLGDWTTLRYDLKRQQTFDEIGTKKMYNNIESILTTINNKRRC